MDRLHAFLGSCIYEVCSIPIYAGVFRDSLLYIHTDAKDE